MKKYCATITDIGKDATRLLENGLCIIFNNNAPPALADLSFMHTIETLEADVCAGDTVTLGGVSYPVLEVGYEANRTLKELGHCSMWLFDSSTGEKHRDCLPGYIVLGCIKQPDIAVGQTIEIDG